MNTAKMQHRHPRGCRCILFDIFQIGGKSYCDEFGSLPPISSAEVMYSASRSRKLSIVSIIQSYQQLEKNYGKEGASIIQDNCQLTIAGGFAPTSETADIISKALGTMTVMTGSVSRGHENASQSLQMTERPLMSPDELKSMKPGSFIVMKTGAHPFISKLKLFTILHNFFDTFAQWINTSLFGEKALPIRRVSLNSVIAKMPDFPEYSGTFITDFLGIIADPRFIYISDLNNTQKHRYQLYVENRFDLLAAQGEVNVPNFEKDGRIHVKADILGVVADVLNYCRKLLTDSRSFVESYYTVNACGYVDHRIYNPHTYLFFASKEDCEHLKSPKNHYHYIEIDEANILQEYQIMLVHDSLGQEDGSIEMFNSVYPIIMLRNQSDERIVGILTPEDGESFHFHDAHNLLYRKYKAITTNYQVAMHQAICEGEFKYYPLLSDATLIYDLSNSDSSEQHTN